MVRTLFGWVEEIYRKQQAEQPERKPRQRPSRGESGAAATGQPKQDCLVEASPSPPPRKPVLVAEGQGEVERPADVAPPEEPHWTGWMEYDIRPDRRDDAERKLIARRQAGERLGFAESIEWVWEGLVWVPLPGERGEAGLRVPRERLRMRYLTPLKFGDWSLVGVVKRTEGGNLLLQVGEIEPPEEYREGHLVCDYCRTRRERNVSYILLSDQGQWTLVGSTCVKDFLGHDHVSMYALTLEIEESDVGFDDEELGGRGKISIELLKFMTVTWALVRQYGYVSKKRAEETEQSSTSDLAVFHIMEPGKSKLEVRLPEDEDKAKLIIDWVRSRPASTNYDHNLAVVFNCRSLESFQWGLAASAAGAYVKEVERDFKVPGAAEAPQADPYVGTVGEKGYFVIDVVELQTEETPFGGRYRRVWQTDFKMRDGAGRRLRWRTTSGSSLEKDKKYLIAGKVEEHVEWKGNRWTKLSRVNVLADLGPVGQGEKVAEKAAKFADARQKADQIAADAMAGRLKGKKLETVLEELRKESQRDEVLSSYLASVESLGKWTAEKLDEYRASKLENGDHYYTSLRLAEYVRLVAAEAEKRWAGEEDRRTRRQADRGLSSEGLPDKEQFLRDHEAAWKRAYLQRNNKTFGGAQNDWVSAWRDLVYGTPWPVVAAVEISMMEDLKEAAGDTPADKLRIFVLRNHQTVENMIDERLAAIRSEGSPARNTYIEDEFLRQSMSTYHMEQARKEASGEKTGGLKWTLDYGRLLRERLLRGEVKAARKRVEE